MSEQWLDLIPLRCPIHWLTGLHCPTCGLGHSIFYLIQGDWAKAWEAQPLGPLLVGGLAVALLLPKPTLLKVESALRQWPLLSGLFFLYALFRAA